MTDTRQHILATGRALAAQRGYTGVGLTELLREAGVPKGSFYHFLRSKEAFGWALLDSFVESYAEDLATTLGARTRMPGPGSWPISRAGARASRARLMRPAASW